MGFVYAMKCICFFSCLTLLFSLQLLSHVVDALYCTRFLLIILVDQQDDVTELNFFIIMLDHNVKKGLSIDRNIFGYRGNLKI